MTAFLPGLCSVTFRKLPAGAVIDLALAAGLSGIEWGGDVHVPAGDEKTARDTARRCRDEGLAIPSYGTYIRAGATDPQQHISPVLDSAAALGATNIRIWAGDKGSAAADGGQRKRVADAVRECAAAAEPHSIRVSLEYHRNTLTDTLASTIDLLAEVDHPNCFTYWQPVPETPADIAVAELRDLSDALSHLHVFHWLSGNVRRPLAEGETFWNRAIEGPSGGQWTGARYAFLEFVRDDDPEQFAADAAVLTGILATGTGQHQNEST